MGESALENMVKQYTDNLTLSLANNSLPISQAINLSSAFPIPSQKNDILGIWNVTNAVSTDTT
jgi:hypothetical protein